MVTKRVDEVALWLLRGGERCAMVTKGTQEDAPQLRRCAIVTKGVSHGYYDGVWRSPWLLRG